MAWLNTSSYKPWTRSDMKGALKRFMKWLRNGDFDKNKPFPPEVSWIVERLKQNELEEPIVITGEEAQRMISSAPTLRDKAMLAVAHEGGFRVGELLGMQVQDVILDEKGARVSVKGKTGPRTVRLITSSPLLAGWLEIHRAHDTGGAPLWYGLTNGRELKGLGYGAAIKVVRGAAKRAGVTKRIYPHLFRHSAATRDARFLTEHELIVKYGWARDSSAPARYVHLSGKDIDDKLVSVYTGKEIEPVKPDFEPVICQRCKEKNTQGMRFCGRCGTPLDTAELAKASVELQEMRTELLEIRRLLAGLTSSPSASGRRTWAAGPAYRD